MRNSLNKRLKNKRLKVGIALLIIFLVITEITLRKVWGFCDAVLYRADKKFEYIQVPQKRKRFGNVSYYNAYSQRNDEISDKDSIVSFFGDSVINGGVLIDQDSLATTKLTKYLTLKYKHSIKVLNIAAGSWGPDNCFGYLQEYGDFKTKKIVLIVSSHDAYDDMNFEEEVGVNPEYLSKQYPLALEELFGKYLIPILFKSFSKAEPSGINKRTKTTPFNSGFNNFYRYTAEHKIPLLIYLHAEKVEWDNKQYNEQGQEIINFCKQRNIPLIKELDYHLPSASYLDGIHLNSLGQEKLFEIFKDILIKQ